MAETVEAIYENGILRLVQPLQGIPEHSTVKVTVEIKDQPHHPLADCLGTLSDEDAADMLRIIEDEFEQVNLSEWQ
ncbi:MAG: antitoxin family protein [Acidobacteria bacterium]|nr:antitoxin family protein [Acidobacteriota bacterium]